MGLIGGGRRAALDGMRRRLSSFGFSRGRSAIALRKCDDSAEYCKLHLELLEPAKDLSPNVASVADIEHSISEPETWFSNARLNSYHSSLTLSSQWSVHLMELVDIHFVKHDARLGEHCRGPSIKSMLPT
jgi:hypothetical protein